MATIPTLSTYTDGTVPTIAQLNATAQACALAASIPVGIEVQKTATVALTANTAYTVSWDQAVWNPDAMWSSGTTITVNTPGYWYWSWQLMIVNAQTVNWSPLIYILHNGAQALGNYEVGRAKGSYNSGNLWQFAGAFHCVAGDTIQMTVTVDQASQTTGISFATPSGASTTHAGYSHWQTRLFGRPLTFG